MSSKGKDGPDVVEPPQQRVEDRGLDQRILKQLRKRQRARGIYDNEFVAVDRRTKEEKQRAAERRAAREEQRRKDALEASGGAAAANASESDSDDGMDAALYKSEADAFEETLLDLPWPYLRVRLDRINSFRPTDLLRFVFVRHSTGFSYAFLLASYMLIGIYIAMVITRFVDAGRQNTESFAVALQEEESLLGTAEPDPLSALTGFRYRFEADPLLNDERPLDVTVVDYSFQQCSRAETRAGGSDSGLLTAFETTCSDLGVTTRQIGGELYVTPGGDAVLDDGLDTNKAATFVRFTLSRCAACNSTLAEVNAAVAGGTLEFAGNSHAETDPPELDDDVLSIVVREAEFAAVTGLTHLSEIVYRRHSVIRHARFFVDGDSGRFAEFLEPREGFIPDGNAAGGVLFQVDLLLDGERTEVNVLEVAFIDLVAAIAALIVVIQAFGILPYLYNRYHFVRYGEFQDAGLPKRYIDRVYDPKAREPVVGRKGIKSLRAEHKYTETEFNLRQTMKSLTGVRETLRPLVESALHEEMEKEERA